MAGAGWPRRSRPSPRWAVLRDVLGTNEVLHRLTQIGQAQQRQETAMGKLTDELNDVSRRLDAVREAQTSSTTNIRGALERLESEVSALRDGDLTEEQQARVDAIKAAADDLRSAAESADDGYEAPLVEPAPVPAVEGQPVPGTVEDRQTGAI